VQRRTVSGCAGGLLPVVEHPAELIVEGVFSSFVRGGLVAAELEELWTAAAHCAGSQPMGEGVPVGAAAIKEGCAAGGTKATRP